MNRVLILILAALVFTLAAPRADAQQPGGERDTVAAARQVLQQRGGEFGWPPDLSDLRWLGVTRSLGADHVRFQQTIAGWPVYGAYVTVHVPRGDAMGPPAPRVTSRYRPGARSPDLGAGLSRAAAIQIAGDAVGGDGRRRGEVTAEQVVYPWEGQYRLAWRVVTPALEPLGDWEVFVDAARGTILDRRNRIVFDGRAGAGARIDAGVPWPGPRSADVSSACGGSPDTGWVFDPNPVVTAGDISLRDNGDADSAALSAQRRWVSLPGLDGSGLLRGPYADLTAPGIVGGYRSAGQADEPVCRYYDYPRSDGRFEEVMAYYHVDRVQRYLQSLGFANANNRSTPIHAHYFALDQSFYSFYDRGLHFGDGGVDDAEDADIIIHEYGHAIQDNQVPGWGVSEESGAMGEGFGDYLAADVFADANGGFDRACVGDWDATSYSAADPPCLRRVDGTLRYPVDMTGDVHHDGQIWSAALWQLRLSLADAPLADRLIVESQFALDPVSGFVDGANAVLAADGDLYSGRHQAAICQAFAARGILSDCARYVRGDVKTYLPELMERR
jgi:Zn-dependent metalloprotease